MAEIPPELFRTIRRIHIETKHLAEDVLAGSYRSAFKGKGIEFEEVREFQEGDEVRSVDWNVTARMNHPYVKKFREERELSVVLIVDTSLSERFGSTDRLKSELIAEIGAVLAFSAIKNNDKVGLILFSSEVEQYLAPRNGVRHVLRVIRELLAFNLSKTKPAHKGTSIEAALGLAAKVLPHSSVCFLLSDFIGKNFEKELRLVAAKHDLVSICVSDPYEITFPAFNLVDFEDLETGEAMVIDGSDKDARSHFEKIALARLAKQEALMKSVGAGFIQIRTDKPYMHEIKKFFRLRSRG